MKNFNLLPFLFSASFVLWCDSSSAMGGGGTPPPSPPPFNPAMNQVPADIGRMNAQAVANANASPYGEQGDDNSFDQNGGDNGQPDDGSDQDDGSDDQADGGDDQGNAGPQQ